MPLDFWRLPAPQSRYGLIRRLSEVGRPEESELVSFTVTAGSALRPEQIMDEIFDITNWSGFTGWGPIPGIREAKMLERHDARVGTKFVVTNTDGSTHGETVIEYVPDRRLVMRIDDFSTPLDKFAECFLETWEFERRDHHTHIERKFDLHPKGPIANVILRLVGFGLRKAVQEHTQALAMQR